MAVISILITTYRAIEHLKCCVHSILQLDSTHDLEVVIYGDGGGAESAQAIEWCRKALADAGVASNCIYNPINAGMCPALNRAAAAASGDWLYILNDDMVIAKTYFRRARPYLKPGRVLSTSSIEPPLPGRRIARCLYAENLGLDPENFVFDKLNAFENSLPETALVSGVNYPFFIERSLFESCGGFDERFPGPYMDPDLFLRLKLRGIELVRAPFCVVYHFSGVSMRFGLDTEKVVQKTANWVRKESEARLYYIQKWGAKPHARFGAIPATRATSPWSERTEHTLPEVLTREGLLLWEKVRRQMRLLRYRT